MGTAQGSAEVKSARKGVPEFMGKLPNRVGTIHSSQGVIQGEFLMQLSSAIRAALIALRKGTLPWHDCCSEIGEATGTL